MPPTKKRRQDEYFDLGVQGRRTGITLPENTRDSFGIEDIDGIFSSPEKSPSTKPTHHGKAPHPPSSFSSAEMDLETSAPEPTHVLSSRKQQLLRSTKSTLPPPSARSPFRTHLGSSPRRRRSSIAPPVKRRLEFRADIPRPSIEKPDVYPDPQLLYPQKNSCLSSSASREQTREEYPDPDESLAFVNGHEFMIDGYGHSHSASMHVDLVDANGHTYSSPTARKQKQSRKSASEEYADVNQYENERETSLASLPNGAPNYSDTELDAESPQDAYLSPPHMPPANALNNTRPQYLDPRLTENQNSSPNKTKPPSPHKPSTSPAQRKKPVLMPPPLINPVIYPIEDEDEAGLDSDTSGDDYQPSAKKPPPPAAGNRKGKNVLRDKDVNTSGPHTSKNSSAMNGKNLWKQESRKPKHNGKLAIAAREPTVEPVVTTRSGRRTIPPVAHWRAEEKVLYRWDGHMLDVNRAPSEDFAVGKPRGKTRPKKRPKSKSKEPGSVQEDEPVELEEWEELGRIMVGTVKGWERESGQTLQNEDYDAEIAHGPNSVHTKDVTNANFRYGKILNIPFMGAGILEIPSGGFKREKNAHKMHMVFFVQTGKVDVKVADNEIVVSAGGCWQVPRASQYPTSQSSMSVESKDLKKKGEIQKPFANVGERTHYWLDQTAKVLLSADFSQAETFRYIMVHTLPALFKSLYLARPRDSSGYV